jgi:hypothetical protein
MHGAWQQMRSPVTEVLDRLDLPAGEIIAGARKEKNGLRRARLK